MESETAQKSAGRMGHIIDESVYPGIRMFLEERNENMIPTRRLHDAESYVTQETHLFHDSIDNNIAIGKPGHRSFCWMSRQAIWTL